MIPFWIQSQDLSINGVVTSLENGKTIENINILVKDSISNTIISYAISDHEGKFSMKIGSDIANLYISIVDSRYENYKKPLEHSKENNSQILTHHISLQKRIIPLEEVYIVSERKTRVKNDTTFYKVSSFVTGEEKVIEDVLTKLPGIKVMEDGRIKFKGKEIESVLIEGDNLFNHDYTRGTRNINIGIIDEIQALENFSENKLLKNIEDSQKIALNLTLKKDVSDISTNTDVGYGYNDERDINLNALLISKSIKAFSFVEHNNIGKSTSSISREISGLNNSSRRNQLRATNMLDIQNISTPLSQKRANINNAWAGAFNGLFNLSSTSKLAVDYIYYDDVLKRTQSNQVEFTFDNDPLLAIDNTSIINKRPVIHNANLSITQDISNKSILKYQGEFLWETIDLSSDILNNDEIQSSLFNAKSTFLNNSIEYTQKTNEKTAFQFISTLSYDDSAQDYSIAPGLSLDNNSIDDTDSTIQNIISEKLRSENHFSFFHKNNRTKFHIKTGLEYQEEKLNTDLIDADSNTFLNDLTYQQLNPFLQVLLTLKTKKWTVRAFQNTKYLNLDLTNLGLGKQQSNRFVFNPKLDLNFKPSLQSTFSFSYSYNEFPQSVYNLHPESILTSFRSIRKNTVDLTTKKVNNSSISFNYADAFNSLNFNITGSYNNIQDNYIFNQDINRDIAISSFFIANNSDKNYTISFNLNKNLAFIRTNTELNSSYSISKYRNLVNSSDIRNNTSKNLTNTLVLKNGFFKKKVIWINTFEHQNSNFETESGLTNKLNSFRYRTKITYQPLKKLTLGINYDFYNPSLENTKSKTFSFLDTSLNYRIKDDIDFTLTGNNLLGIKDYVINTNSDFSTATSTFNLIDRYIMLKLSFKF
ncbi:hypothetical protein GCM10009430_09070 [Aquimarina litoralis]|uniref:Uncharacterized protein n=2 Tax=Aquimarina litoralis TaxID=584605 RepID=A0ABN1IJ34_9FLAO